MSGLQCQMVPLSIMFDGVMPRRRQLQFKHIGNNQYAECRIADHLEHAVARRFVGALPVADEQYTIGTLLKPDDMLQGLRKWFLSIGRFRVVPGQRTAYVQCTARACTRTLQMGMPTENHESHALSSLHRVPSRQRCGARSL